MSRVWIFSADWRHRCRAAAVALALAPGVSHAEIALDHPWAQATPPRAVVARAYVEITNQSGETDHLIGVTTDAAASAEIAGIRVLQDVPNLRRLFNIDIPAGRRIVFAPGGYHILLRNLKKPLAVGDRVNINLSFENAGDVSGVFVVENGPSAPVR